MLSLESQCVAFVFIIYQNGRFEPFVLLYNKLLNDWSLGNSEFCFPPISVFSLDFVLPTISGSVFQGLKSRFGKYLGLGLGLDLFFKFGLQFVLKLFFQ